MKTAIETYLEQVNSISPQGYKEFFTWLMENGKSYKEVTNDIWKYGHLVGTAEMKACFKNSLIAAVMHEELKYVEGYYVTEHTGFPLEHGFNVNEEGEVVDTTATAFGIPVREYYGVEIDRKYFQKFIGSKYNGMTSLLHWYYMKVVCKN